MSKVNLTIEQVNALDPMEIVTNDSVRDRFIQIYEAMWTPSTGISGESAYERESRNFNRILAEKEEVRKNSTRFSLFTAFLDLAISGLTLDPGSRAQAYLLNRSVAVDSYVEAGQKKTRYESHCVLTISGYGELLYRSRVGQIRHADNPIIVYEEDDFEFGERNGNKFVNYTCRLPHSSGHIVACFMKITRADGSLDYAIMLPEDWNRLAGFSARQNRRYDYTSKQWINGSANALYGQQQDGSCKIDSGFLIAKLIKHAFKSYPKARVGRATQLESQQTDEEEITDDIYGLAEDGSVIDTSTGEVLSAQSVPDAASAPAPAAGVVFNASNDDVF